MRVVTWNVLWRFEPDWRARERGILTTLERLSPDLVGLQECWATDTDTQAHLIARHLDLYAAYAGPSLPPEPDPPEHPEQAGVRMGVGLVSRWPIRVVAHHALPVSHRQIAPMALEVELAAPRGPVRVLVAAVEWEPEYADDHLAQTTALAHLLETATPSAPALLLADLNCDPGQAEFAPLAGVADDTWSVGGGAADAVTLSSTVPFAPLEATKEMDRRIDHVLAAPRGVVDVAAVRIIAEPVGGQYPSDHFPVVVELELPHQGPRGTQPEYDRDR